MGDGAASGDLSFFFGRLWGDGILFSHGTRYDIDFLPAAALSAAERGRHIIRSNPSAFPCWEGGGRFHPDLWDMLSDEN